MDSLVLFGSPSVQILLVMWLYDVKRLDLDIKKLIESYFKPYV